MRVAFLHVDLKGHEAFRQLAELMVWSVKRFNHEVIQMTDEESREIPGVDTVVRKPREYPFLMQYRLEHFRSMPGEVLFVDTDTLMLKDPSSAFDDCDVALTKRSAPILLDGQNITGAMPYNTGVMFSRNPKFWDDCFKYSWGLSDELKNWFGDQLAVKAMAESGKYKVKELPCSEYNFTPKKGIEGVEGKYIAHFKGNRKPAQIELARLLKESVCASS